MSAFGSFDRAAALARLAEDEFDVLVIGGGITGAGVALDAASRGMRTALVERDDFASGTSSKSSKLVHGGLRYLQQGDVRLVYEALAERQRLRKNAPHLVKIMPFLIPIFSGKDGVVPKKLARAMGSAMWMYDLTGGLRIGKIHKRIKKDEAVAHMPTLRQERLDYGYLYYDAQADDARLTLTILRTAVLDHGAAAANRAAVTAILRDSAGRARGATVRADENDLDVRAKVVVNATGVWSDKVRALDEGTNPGTIRPAKGIHITVPWDKVRNDIAVVVPVPKDRRSVFVVPWGDLTYIGTTDTDYDGPLDDPQCTPEDIAYLLGAINTSSSAKISESDIVGTWAGLRPLVKSVADGRTADLSRGHKVTTSASGMITINGGKLTTYRHMAADTVDEAADLAGTKGRSRTKRLRLRGAEGYEAMLERNPHLANRYGGEAETVAAMADREPELHRPLVAGLPYLRAEAVYAARYEMAQTVDDVLSRRTRARLLARDASIAAAPDVANLVGDVLDWSSEQRAAQITAFKAIAERERSSAGLTDLLSGTNA